MAIGLSLLINALLQDLLFALNPLKHACNYSFSFSDILEIDNSAGKNLFSVFLYLVHIFSRLLFSLKHYTAYTGNEPVGSSVSKTLSPTNGCMSITDVKTF